MEELPRMMLSRFAVETSRSTAQTILGWFATDDASNAIA